MLTQNYKDEALKKLNNSSSKHISETLSAIGSKRVDDDWIPKTYASPFTRDIEIFSPKDAIYVIHHFCEYCNKGAIDAFHCAGVDSMKCEAVKEQIIKDWSRKN